MKKQVIEIPKGYELKQDGNTYTIVKKENKLPKSWEELKEVSGWWMSSSSQIIEGIYPADRCNRNTFRTREQAEASIALAQLTQLIHVWREGWEPDWSKISPKWGVYVCHELKVSDFINAPKTISFETKEKAKKFLTTFEDLIKTAAPLLWGVTLK